MITALRMNVAFRRSTVARESGELGWNTLLAAINVENTPSRLRGSRPVSEAAPQGGKVLQISTVALLINGVMNQGAFWGRSRRGFREGFDLGGSCWLSGQSA